MSDVLESVQSARQSKRSLSKPVPESRNAPQNDLMPKGKKKKRRPRSKKPKAKAAGGTLLQKP